MDIEREMQGQAKYLPPPLPRRRWWALVAIAAAAALAATLSLCWDGRRSTSTLDAQQARGVALDELLPEEQRRAAIASIFHETKENIRVLHAVAARSDAIGRDARLYLQKLEDLR